MANEETRERNRLLEVLPASLAVMVALLGAVGGVTGGISRMVRNNPELALATLVLAIVAVLFAVLSLLPHRLIWAAGVLVPLSLVAFALSLGTGVWLAVDTTNEADRPSLAVKVVQTRAGVWTLRGTAAASGLPADGSMQIYVYALPEDEDESRSQLFYVTAGPDAAGVARQAFRLPLPDDRAYRSFVVTAALGDKVRYCDGTPLSIGAGLDPTTLDNGDGQNACLSVMPPTSLRPENDG
jgi:hypothetical protein